ncbi:TSUP family transporter [Clostridiaceae bacterium M8S5]|nr:TSUP family transporter [Clostridiaceae bacterium M8S5]
MLLLSLGLITGIISGMGIGGGTILIPGLILLTSLTQKQAQGINLFIYLPTATIALITHFYNKNLKLKPIIPIILMGIIGSIVGAKMAVVFDSNILRIIFAIFLLIMGVHELFVKDT